MQSVWGEGEYPTLDIAMQLQEGKSPTRVNGVLFASEDTCSHATRGQFIQDLDQVPFPERKMWDDSILFPGLTHTILVSRGCPYSCSYCCNHALRKLSDGKYVRYRSPEKVVQELETVLRQYPKSKFVYFESECFNANLPFALGLASELQHFRSRRGLRVTFGANIKVIPGQDYGDLFDRLSRAGFLLANVGLESGNDRVRSQVLRRVYSNADVVNVVRAAKAKGLFVRLYAMIGIPGETASDFQDTIRCVKQLRPDLVDLSCFYPYPGTDIHRLCAEQGLLHVLEDPRAERKRPAYSLPGFSSDEIRKQYRSFFRCAGVQKPLPGLLRFLRDASLLP